MKNKMLSFVSAIAITATANATNKPNTNPTIVNDITNHPVTDVRIDLDTSVYNSTDVKTTNVSHNASEADSYSKSYSDSVSRSNSDSYARGGDADSYAKGGYADVDVRTGNTHTSARTGDQNTNLSNSGNSSSDSYSRVGNVGSASNVGDIEVGGSGDSYARTGPISNDTYSSNRNSNSIGDQRTSVGDTTSRVGDTTARTGPVTNTNTTASSSNSGGNSIDVSDRRVNNSRTTVTFIPTVTQITPSSTVGVGNIIKETLACGPLQAIQSTDVNGKFFKVFGTKDVPQGWTHELVPYTNERGELQMYVEHTLPDGSVRLFGHQPIIFTTIVGVSGNKNFQIGGGAGNGWGQGGAGSSSANQRMITNIQLRFCEVGIMKPVDQEIVYVEVEKAKIRE